jgi:hypothetical protein
MSERKMGAYFQKLASFNAPFETVFLDVHEFSLPYIAS